MSRKQRPAYVVLAISVMSLVLGSTASWAMGKTPPPSVWVVHIQNFDFSGQTGLWPESVTADGAKANWPALHRSHKDKIQFVIDSGASSCELVFDDGSPLVPLGQPNDSADTIRVYSAGGPANPTFVVSPKVKIPKNGYCQYWFHILGNPDCGPRPHKCLKGTPSPLPPEYPCWVKHLKQAHPEMVPPTFLQIGPGMDVSD
jgi:hypothetical protein